MIVLSNHFKREFDLSKAELIGQGNFAQVYRIFDSETQKYLAIRKVDRSLGESDDIEKQKTINEELRRVDNEHILKIYEIIETQSCIWYIAEYCQGGSLWDALNACTDNKMNQKDGLEVIYQISKGVKQLHNHRITHRDLKPENILLKTKYIVGKPVPVIKIADFGLSTKKIIMETIAGTKQYIAPQQARFHNYTNAVDVWSLGIIFDEILHGSPFYVGDNNKQVFQKILKNPYKVRDETIRPTIQQFLISVLKKKAYERPIITVICQSIEKILQEIKQQRQGKTEVKEKPMNFQKRNCKQVFNAQQIKPQQRQNDQMQTQGKTQGRSQFKKQQRPQSRMRSITIQAQLQKKSITVDVRQLDKNNDKKNDLNSLSSTKREQRKAKTPFKRQNGRPQLLKQQSQQNTDLQNSTDINHRSQRTDTGIHRRQIQRGLQRQSSINQVVQGIDKHDQTDNQKINVYRVQKKKVPYLPPKIQQLGQNIVEVKEYMENVIKMKNQLLQSSITVTKDKDFNLNSQLVMSELTEKFDSEQILKDFRKRYDFLNYLNYSQDYQIKLHIGRSSLFDQKQKVVNQMLKHKQKLKADFISQIDKIVDSYVQKVIK